MKNPFKKTSYNVIPIEDLVYDLEVKTKEQALHYLYRAGIVTQKGNLRKFYRNTDIDTNKSKTKAKTV